MNPTTHRSLQKEYFALKKKYKKQVKLMHKKYKNDLINEINALSSEHSQDVWRQINKLRKESTVEEETLLSPEAWIQHFRQLLYDNNETNENTNFANDADETENLSDYSRTLILQRSRQGINFSIPLLNLYYFTVVKYGDQNYYHKTHFDKSTFEQVHIKFCKQTLNSPWYTENKASRVELGRYPLSIDIKASLLCYWQRLEQKSDDPLVNKAFIYARTQSKFYGLLNSDNYKMHYKNEVIKISNVLRTLVLALKNSCRKTFLKIG